MLAACLGRLEALLDAIADRTARVIAGTRLLDALIKTGDGGAAQRVAERFRRELGDPEVRPLAGAWCRVWLATRLSYQARFEEGEALLQEALAIAEGEHLGFLVPTIQLMRAWIRFAQGDAAGMSEIVGRLAASADPARKLETALLRWFEGCIAALRGDFTAAEGATRIAARLSLETGSVPATFLCHSGLLLALDATGQRAEAEAVLERMRGLVAGVRGGFLRYQMALWEAHILLGRGAEGFRAPLAEALALGRREGYFSQSLWWPPMMSRLCGAALEAGIETDYVRELVTRRRLAPPEERTAEHWPWPLRVRTLGRFEVARDGAPLEVRGKAQKKPLELLKALVALGGEGVDASRLAALLWPDADGDAAKASFDTTLYRLRKLLGRDDRARARRGQALPRPAPVLGRRLDVRAGRARGRRARSGRRRPGGRIRSTSGGRSSTPIPATSSPATRTRRGRSTCAIGCARSSRGPCSGSASACRRPGGGARQSALYERALELDNLAEGFYRGLMICHRELGQPAAGLQAYRRCRELLSVVLGLAPSAETEAVRRSLDATR